MSAIAQDTRSQDIPSTVEGGILYEKYLKSLKESRKRTIIELSAKEELPMEKSPLAPPLRKSGIVALPPEPKKSRQVASTVKSEANNTQQPVPKLPGSAELKELAQKRDELKNKQNSEALDSDKEVSKKIANQDELENLPILDESSKAKIIAPEIAVTSVKADVVSEKEASIVTPQVSESDVTTKVNTSSEEVIEQELKEVVTAPKPEKDNASSNTEIKVAENVSVEKSESDSSKADKDTKMLVQSGGTPAANTKIKSDSRIKSILAIIFLILLLVAAALALKIPDKTSGAEIGSDQEAPLVSQLSVIKAEGVGAEKNTDHAGLIDGDVLESSKGSSTEVLAQTNAVEHVSQEDPVELKRLPVLAGFFNDSITNPSQGAIASDQNYREVEAKPALKILSAFSK